MPAVVSDAVHASPAHLQQVACKLLVQIMHRIQRYLSIAIPIPDSITHPSTAKLTATTQAAAEVLVDVSTTVAVQPVAVQRALQPLVSEIDNIVNALVELEQLQAQAASASSTAPTAGAAIAAAAATSPLSSSLQSRGEPAGTATLRVDLSPTHSSSDAGMSMESPLARHARHGIALASQLSGSRSTPPSSRWTRSTPSPKAYSSQTYPPLSTTRTEAQRVLELVDAVNHAVLYAVEPRAHASSPMNTVRAPPLPYVRNLQPVTPPEPVAMQPAPLQQHRHHMQHHQPRHQPMQPRQPQLQPTMHYHAGKLSPASSPSRPLPIKPARRSISPFSQGSTAYVPSTAEVREAERAADAALAQRANAGSSAWKATLRSTGHASRAARSNYSRASHGHASSSSSSSNNNSKAGSRKQAPNTSPRVSKYQLELNATPSGWWVA